MEDILVELVGEIEDEFRPRPGGAVSRTERTPVGQWRGTHTGAPCAARLRARGTPRTTVGGYLSEQLARVPDTGELVECHGHRFEILAVDERRITEVAVLGNADPEDEQHP
jgi:CBS domain containing-hemolysin-like protein